MLLTLLLTSPRVAPGLLSASAWRLLDSSATVRARDLDAPLARAVVAAGVEVSAAGPPTARDLLAAAREHGSLVWLATDEEAETLPRELAAWLADPAGAMPDGGQPRPPVEVVHGSYDVPGARLLDLVAVMDRLREECPWDREQTHASLAPYLLEETYETLEAIESGVGADLREELGDLLLQVVFHARLASETAEEAGGFDVDDVAAGIVGKLVHRHPHVFAETEVSGRDAVEANWEALKHAEKGRASVLDGVPLALPALALADKLLSRAARVGVTPTPVETGDAADRVGEELLALVVQARKQGLDAEQALRERLRALATQVRAAEQPH